MQVYSLVGPSGTGKSYKALEVAYENDISYIIDDGILIHENRIIAGISAKQASTKIEAVKRAIFHNADHRMEVKEKIKKVDIDKLLILGTSNRMINQIVERLELEDVNKVINISDISSVDEINKAKESRKKGNHIIPVPTVQIKPMTNGISINPLKRLFKRNNKINTVIEKTVIRPTFSYIGKFSISPNVINQIVEYEVYKFNKIEKINKLEITKPKNINISINININDATIIKDCYKVQKKVKDSIEKITLINVDKVDIYINKLKKNNKNAKQA